MNKKINVALAFTIVFVIAGVVGLSLWWNAKSVPVSPQVAEVSIQKNEVAGNSVSSEKPDTTPIVNVENSETEKVVKSFYDWYFEKLSDPKTYESLKKDNTNDSIFFKSLLSQNNTVLSNFVNSLSEKHYFADPVTCSQGVVPNERNYKQISILKSTASIVAQHDDIKIVVGLKNVNDSWKIASVSCPNSK